MKKRIKKDDLLGRYYEVTTKQGRRFHFRAEQLTGELQNVFLGHNTEQEPITLRVSQIGSLRYRGEEVELELGPDPYGAAEWLAEAQERDRLHGSSIAQQIKKRLDETE